MKFKVFIAVLFYLFSTNVSLIAQETEYSDLLVLYVDEEYEKCLKKAEKYMSKDESKNDPLPYLYTSMSYYEMSRDNKYNEAYPKAYYSCLSYLTNYRKKDKTFAYKSDAEPFIEKIKLVIAEEIDNYMLDGSEKADKKINSLLKKLVRIDPNDPGVELLLGVYYDKTKNRSESKKYIASGIEKVMEIGDSIMFGDMTKSQQLYLKESMIAYYKLKKDRYPVEAKELFMKGENFFAKENENCLIENKDDYMKVYKLVTG